MAVETFTWGARIGDQGDITYATQSAAFADGYEQTVSVGINNKSGSWPYTYIGPIEEVQPIMDFLDAHAGSKSFQWTPPFSAQGLYKCAGYSISPKGGPLLQLTATFKQSFSL
ncbi:phage tail protein [Paraburkholderia tropica]|uniref:phage tail protein n=1 Tax=Paraburkholderia tropica TaxID=92647 RepID=UPI00160410A2|nr:phage tail protein [Paraburkholderia tropica]QNB10826.1 phage tail protein [Paraburkholderia tropica]